MKLNTATTASRKRAAFGLAALTGALAVRILAQDAAVDDSAWAKMDSRVLNKLPSTFVLRPTHFEGVGRGMAGGIVRAGNKMLGRALSFDMLLSLAYDVDVHRIVLPADKPAGGFDLLMTTPDASGEKLQAELTRIFGYSGRMETRTADVLVLQMKQAGAPGLKPGQGRGGGSMSSGSSSFSGGGGQAKKLTLQNQPISSFIKSLQRWVDKPVLDKTGLQGTYDITLEVSTGDAASENDAIAQALATQLGLALVPSTEPLEILVVEKAK